MRVFGRTTCTFCGAVDIGVKESVGNILRFVEHRRAPKRGCKSPMVEPGGASDWCDGSNKWVGDVLETELRKKGAGSG